MNHKEYNILEPKEIEKVKFLLSQGEISKKALCERFNISNARLKEIVKEMKADSVSKEVFSS